MKVVLQAKNEIVKVRKLPNNSAVITSTLNAKTDTTQYTATKLYKGWYYIDAIYGWVNNIDMLVINVIEAYNPLTDQYSYDSTEIGNTKETGSYDGGAIIDAINETANKSINAIKILYQDGNNSTNAQTVIKQLLNGLSDINTALTQISDFNETVADVDRIKQYISDAEYSKSFTSTIEVPVVEDGIVYPDINTIALGTGANDLYVTNLTAIVKTALTQNIDAQLIYRPYVSGDGDLGSEVIINNAQLTPLSKMFIFGQQTAVPIMGDGIIYIKLSNSYKVPEGITFIINFESVKRVNVIS